MGTKAGDWTHSRWAPAREETAKAEFSFYPYLRASFFQAVFRLKQQYDRRLIQAPEDTHAPRWAEGPIVGDVGAVGDGAAAGPLGEVTPGRSRKAGGGEDVH